MQRVARVRSRQLILVFITTVVIHLVKMLCIHIRHKHSQHNYYRIIILVIIITNAAAIGTQAIIVIVIISRERNKIN